MKTKYVILSLTITAVLSGCRFDRHTDNISIAIKDDEKGFNLEANYPEEKTKKVVAYIEKTLKEDQLFTTETDVKDGDVSLGDSIKFYMKAEPGFLIIDFKKHKNSLNGYQKMEDLCRGIKDVIGQ